MNSTLLWLVTAAYLGIALDNLIKRQLPMAIVFSGYAIANVGLIAMQR